jgi:hypothetical protein
MASQISAIISDETKELLEKYARANGLKKGYLIEHALLHHLQAIENLPQEVIVPAQLTVSREVIADIAAMIENPEGPTEAMMALFESD